eukprot:3115123-Prymnesium_polylepis.4
MNASTMRPRLPSVVFAARPAAKPAARPLLRSAPSRAAPPSRCAPPVERQIVAMVPSVPKAKTAKQSSTLPRTQACTLCMAARTANPDITRHVSTPTAAKSMSPTAGSFTGAGGAHGGGAWALRSTVTITTASRCAKGGGGAHAAHALLKV